MPDQPELSQELARKLDELVDRVVAAHEFSDDVRRELRSHLEDKAAAYLSGEERLGEADVLLLVERHFGDPAHLRTILRESSGAESCDVPAAYAEAGVFFRLLAAAIVAAVIASFVLQVAEYMVRAFILPGFSSHTISIALATLSLVLLLDRWAVRVRRGDILPPWFIRLPASQMIVTLAIAVAACWAVPYVSIGPWTGDYGMSTETMTWIGFVRLMFQIVASVYVLSWIVWRGSGSPRTQGAIHAAVAAAALFVCATIWIGPAWAVGRDETGQWMTQVHYRPVTILFWQNLAFSHSMSLIGMAAIGACILVVLLRPRLIRYLRQA